MKEAILKALKLKFEGVSDNILGRVADRIAKTATVQNEEEAQTEVDKYSLQQLLDSYADSRTSEAVNSAIANYEKKHGIKDGKLIETQKQPTPKVPDETVPEWAKALIADNQALKDSLADMARQKLAKDRRSVLMNEVQKLPEALRKPYERIALDGLSEEDFNSLVSDTKSDVEDIAKTMNVKGAVTGHPTMGNGSASQASDKELDDVIKMMNV